MLYVSFSSLTLATVWPISTGVFLGEKAMKCQLFSCFKCRKLGLELGQCCRRKYIICYVLFLPVTSYTWETFFAHFMIFFSRSKYVLDNSKTVNALIAWFLFLAVHNQHPGRSGERGARYHYASETAGEV